MIQWLKDSLKVHEVGMKAYQLGLLMKAGFNVPNGFVIPTTAYQDYMKQHDMYSKIEFIMASTQPMKEKASLIKNLYLSSSLPQGLQEHILHALKELDEPVAVRSSSNAEDLPEASFAGQYSTYLNVTSGDISKKILACWASTWNERALNYSQTKGLTTNKPLGVLIQKMVKPTYSGVLFTAHPLQGSRDEMLINITEGLGEALVSGEIIPTEITLDVNGTLIKSSSYATDLGIHTYKELHSIGKAMETYFGQPQDIEFSIDQMGEINILQSRPITTLFPIDHLKKDDKLRAYLCASSVMLGMKEALTPLGADIYGGMFPTIITIMTNQKKPVPTDFVAYEGGRILLDLTYLLSKPLIAKQLGNAFSGSDLPLKHAMSSLLADHGNTFTHQGIKFKIPWGVFSYGFTSLKYYKDAQKTPSDEKYTAIKKLGADLYNDLANKAQSLNNTDAYLDFCKEAMVRVFQLTQRQAFYAIEMSQYNQLAKKLKKVGPPDLNIDLLTYSLPDCITLQMSKDLNALAKYYVDSSLEPDMDDKMMKAFLTKYGHRSTIELDIGYPRWHEDGSYLLDQVKSYMLNNTYKKNLETFQKQEKLALNFMDQVYNHVVKNKGKRYAKALKKKMENYRRAAGMREYPKYNIVQVLDLCRTVMIELGEELVKKQKLNQPEDIFYLHEEDIRRGDYSYDRINKNKENYNREMNRQGIPRLIMNTGKVYYGSMPIPTHAKTIEGIPLSSGTYEGYIRVVHNLEDAHLKKGEILVTESTNPSWTPLFSLAGALIMEYGGPLSHGGIVAREYGLPAVVGIPSATKALRTGQFVRVDGTTGIISILEKDS